jgi:hypothetical protein
LLSSVGVLIIIAIDGKNIKGDRVQRIGQRADSSVTVATFKKADHC